MEWLFRINYEMFLRSAVAFPWVAWTSIQRLRTYAQLKLKLWEDHAGTWILRNCIQSPTRPKVLCSVWIKFLRSLERQAWIWSSEICTCIGLSTRKKKSASNSSQFLQTKWRHTSSSPDTSLWIPLCMVLFFSELPSEDSIT